MLRITIDESEDLETWTLQGWLMGPWVSELRATWERARAQQSGRKRIMNVKDVVSIDPSGELVLQAMLDDGVEIVGACGTYTKSLVAGLERKCKRGWSVNKGE